jgi:hypothetical protein
MLSAYLVLYCDLCPVRLYHIFLHYLINGTIFGKKKIIQHKMCVLFFSLSFSETFLILRRIQRDTIINVHWSSCKVHVILVRFERNLNFLNRVFKNTQKSNFMKIRPLRAEFFHADERTDRETDRRT